MAVLRERLEARLPPRTAQLLRREADACRRSPLLIEAPVADCGRRKPEIEEPPWQMIRHRLSEILTTEWAPKTPATKAVTGFDAVEEVRRIDPRALADR